MSDEEKPRVPDQIKFVDQTILHDPEKKIMGNCMQAALASVFGCRIEVIPAFQDFTDYSWQEIFKEWLYFIGREYKEKWYPSSEDHPRAELYIINGKSPRGVRHSTVWLNGQMIHDPHPSKAGLVNIDSLWSFPRRS